MGDDRRDDPRVEIQRAKKAALESNFLGSNVTRRFAEFVKTKVCDEFLLAAVEFAAAHFRIIEIRRKKKHEVRVRVYSCVFSMIHDPHHPHTLTLTLRK